MGIKLIDEILDHSPTTLTPADRLLLVVIAENANDSTREGFPGWELIARRMRWHTQKDGGKHALGTALRGMAGRGVDVRVPLGHDDNGVPYYAARGRRTTYRIPVLAFAADGQPGEWGQESAPQPERGHQGAPQSQKGGTACPPMAEERGQGRNPKGSSEHPNRGHQDAPPSPHEPSENPHPPQPPRWAEPDDDRLYKYGEHPSTVAEPLRTVWESLLGEDSTVTLDEARAVLKAVGDNAPKRISSVNYFKKIAENGGYGGYLRDVRRANAPDVSRILAAARRDEPECEHGEPAGRFLHPLHQTPLCPECRRGMPARVEALKETTSPEVAAVISAYRLAAVGFVDTRRYVTVTQQATSMLAAGATVPQLVALAQAAAARGLDLLTEATHPQGVAA